MSYIPSDPYYSEFITSNLSTGAALNADSTPTATANKNGTDDGSFTLTVANIDTGRYKITGTVPSGYVAGDTVNITVTATIGAVVTKAAVDKFVIDRVRLATITSSAGVNQTAINGHAVNDPVNGYPSVNVAYVAGALASISTGQARAGTHNTIQLASGETNNPLWCQLTIVSGLGVGGKALVIAYDGASKTATVWCPAGAAGDWAVNPDATSFYAINDLAFAYVYTNADKAGYVLDATGLDSIPVTAPATLATTFPAMTVQLWRRLFRKSTKVKVGTAVTLKTYLDDGTTIVTTQTGTDDGAGNETLNAGT